MSFLDVESWRREDFIYTPCYCEENIWKLCEKLKSGDSSVLNDSYAVFISNDERKVPLWKQRSGQQERDHLVIWDYHVILVVRTKDTTKAYVVDFDTVLGFVVPLTNYVHLAIRSDETILAPFRRKFRIIPAALYLENFASDRSHMLREDENGLKHFVSTPPEYPPIACQGSTNNIQDYISMDCSRGCGHVVDFAGFVSYFGHSGLLT